MSASYRQTIIVELEGPDSGEVFNAQLKVQRVLSKLSTDLRLLKGSAHIIAVIPDPNVREYNPTSKAKS